MDPEQYKICYAIDRVARFISSVRSGTIGVIMALAVLEVAEREIELLELVKQPHLLRFALAAVCLHMAHILVSNYAQARIGRALGILTEEDENDDDDKKDD